MPASPPPRITADWLHAPALQDLLRLLEGAGHQALAVGGCVRNALLGAAVSDIDIATDARPERVIALTEAAGLKAVPTGIEHGTVTVIAGGQPHEITTFRRDVETHGRHATVAFSTDVTEDAARRDFTMNALYARADGQVLDPLGGMGDLRARRVRFVGPPEDRIREDYLRILRFFRFTAWYGAPDQGPEPEGLAACAALAEGVEGLSRERLGAEMKKLLAAPDPAPAVAAMAAAGVLGRVLPGADPTALAPLVHLEADAHPDARPDALARLAVLGGDAPAERLRLSKAETRRLSQLRAAATEGATGPGELGYRLGAPDARLAGRLRAALMGMPLPPDWDAAAETGAAARFPVSARDLMPAFSGPALGQRLARLERAWIASGFALDRGALLALDD
ncbi:CCA tRNA nucleotidyltransferase [Phaeovulum vinaykumarii]|uniref:Poly(A) polymerase n=1 Tax=Phaeovulum vinaykumarii TaxID=407234 RepID=A0A1N7KZW9_9RHOB|nr:CCA tRNA nucleotidyltransferase [Phaeovulum vinaykumarii]SIS67124.1 poly(A) polymerase [Phaeovulum vinaykumarii]SOC00833.1 poly(A) polymerase [Phaeovulum vinaykumarii]